MSKPESHKLVDLSLFEESVSLYQLVPAGDGYASILLRQIVEYILIRRPRKLPTLLILGHEGKRTHALAFLRALAIEDVRVIPAELLQPVAGITSFFHGSHRDSGFVITDVDSLLHSVTLNIHEILQKRECRWYDYLKAGQDVCTVRGVLVLAAESREDVPSSILRFVDYTIELGTYTLAQRFQIVRQRLAYAGVKYENEATIRRIIKAGRVRLHRIIPFLRVCLTRLGAEERNTLREEDVIYAAALCGRAERKPSNRSANRLLEP